MSRNKSTPPFHSVIPYRTGGSAPPLFFLHHVGGIVPDFKGLLNHLDPLHPIYGVQSQAFDRNAPALTSLEEMAAYYLAEMRDMVGPGPYYLIGFSFGGMLAYEMAQQLVACGEEQPFIGMIDATEMSYLKRQAKQKPPVDRAGDLYSRLRRRFAEAFERPDTFAYIREKIESRAMRSLYSLTSRTGVSMPRQMQRPYHVNWFAAINYEPRPFDGHVALFKATGHFWEPGMPEDLGWGDLVRQGIEMVDIPGDHVSLFVEPSVSILGAELCRSMEAFASRSVIAAG